TLHLLAIGVTEDCVNRDPVDDVVAGILQLASQVDLAPYRRREDLQVRNLQLIEEWLLPNLPCGWPSAFLRHSRQVVNKCREDQACHNDGDQRPGHSRTFLLRQPEVMK